jgi:hypothetical protein
MVPVSTESGLHFTARLDGVSSATELRFERAARG